MASSSSIGKPMKRVFISKKDQAAVDAIVMRSFEYSSEVGVKRLIRVRIPKCDQRLLNCDDQSIINRSILNGGNRRLLVNSIVSNRAHVNRKGSSSTTLNDDGDVSSNDESVVDERKQKKRRKYISNTSSALNSDKKVSNIVKTHSPPPYCWTHPFESFVVANADLRDNCERPRRIYRVEKTFLRLYKRVRAGYQLDYLDVEGYENIPLVKADGRQYTMIDVKDPNANVLHVLLPL